MFSSTIDGRGQKSGKTKTKVTLPIPITVAADHVQHVLGLIQDNA